MSWSPTSAPSNMDASTGLGLDLDDDKGFRRERTSEFRFQEDPHFRDLDRSTSTFARDDFERTLRQSIRMDDRATNEIDRLGSKLKDATEEARASTAELKNMRHSFAQLREVKDQAEKELENLRPVSKEKEDLQRAYDKLKKESAADKEQIAKLRDDLNAALDKKALTLPDKRLASQEERIAELENQSGVLRAQVDDLTARLEDASERAGKAECELEAAKQRHQGQLSQTKHKEEELQELRDKLESKVASQQQELDSNHRRISFLENSVTKAQDECEESRLTIEKLTLQVTKLQEELAEAVRGKAGLALEVERWRDEASLARSALDMEREETNSVVSRLRECEAAKNQLEASLARVTREVEVQEAECTAGNKRLAAARQESDRLIHDMRCARRERDDARAALDDLERETVTLRKEHGIFEDALQQSKRREEQLTIDNATLQQNLHARESRIVEVEQDLSVATTRLVEVTALVEAAAERERSLLRELDAAKASGQDAAVALADDRDRVLAQLERVQADFHTEHAKVLELTAAVAEAKATADRAKEQERMLRAECRDYTAAIERLERLRREDAADAAQEISRLQQSIGNARKEAEASKDDARTVTTRAMEEQERGRKDRAIRMRLESDLDRLSSELRKCDTSRLACEAALKDCERENARLNEELLDMRKDREQLKGKHVELIEEIESLKGKFEAVRGNTSYSRLLSEAEALRKVVETTEEASKAAERRYKKEIEELQTRLADREAVVESLSAPLIAPDREDKGMMTSPSRAPSPSRLPSPPPPLPSPGRFTPRPQSQSRRSRLQGGAAGDWEGPPEIPLGEPPTTARPRDAYPEAMVTTPREDDIRPDFSTAIRAEQLSLHLDLPRKVESILRSHRAGGSLPSSPRTSATAVPVPHSTLHKAPDSRPTTPRNVNLGRKSVTVPDMLSRIPRPVPVSPAYTDHTLTKGPPLTPTSRTYANLSPLRSDDPAKLSDWRVASPRQRQVLC